MTESICPLCGSSQEPKIVTWSPDEQVGGKLYYHLCPNCEFTGPNFSSPSDCWAEWGREKTSYDLEVYLAKARLSAKTREFVQLQSLATQAADAAHLHQMKLKGMGVPHLPLIAFIRQWVQRSVKPGGTFNIEADLLPAWYSHPQSYPLYKSMLRGALTTLAREHLIAGTGRGTASDGTYYRLEGAVVTPGMVGRPKVRVKPGGIILDGLELVPSGGNE